MAVFESQRQKEQLLVDRGNEYTHAVKLFVRKFGTYPASLDALENTNKMRFLRRRFVDPFTQKDDWRLLHAGPGGMLLDSKVNPIDPNDTAASALRAERNGSNNSATDSGGETIFSRMRLRPPAISATAGATTQMANTTLSEQDPSTSLLPSGQAEQLTNNSPAAVDAQAELQTGQAQANAQTGAAAQGTPLGSGPIMGGGIAGVASRVHGHSIKVIQDQTDYSLWEFYYDPSKDFLRGTFMNVPLQNGPNVNGTGAPGTTAPTTANPTASGQHP